MHHPHTIDVNRKAVRRTVAVLLALAGLAERAAGRSRAVCGLVLWLLLPGEAIARDYLERLAPGAAGLPEALSPDGDVAQALRLAQSFRALAAALSCILDDAPASWPHVNGLVIALTAVPDSCARSTAAMPVGRRDSS